MLLSHIFSSPFYIYFYIVFLVAMIFDCALFYAIWKHTPPKMNDIKPIFQTMVLFQILFGLSNALGGAPEYMYPLYLLKFHGFYTFLGQKYGGVVSLVTVVLFICLCGVCIIECCMYRFATVFLQIKFRLKLIWFFFVHIILGAIGGSLGMYLASKFFLMDPIDYIIYCKLHRKDYQHPNVNYNTDVVAILEQNSSDYVWIVFTIFFLMGSCVILVYILSLLMYKKLAPHAYTASHHHHIQQKKLTLMLLGQGSLPLLFILTLLLAFLLGASSSARGESPPEICWMLIMQAISCSQFSIFFYVAYLVSITFDLFLFYAIWKHTPKKMNDIKPILQTMVFLQILAGNSNALGSAPEYLYPLYIIRVNGFYYFLGKTYGGVVASVGIILLICLCGLCIVECCIFRYLTVVFHKNIPIKFLWFLPLHILIGIGCGWFGIYVATNYFLMSYDDFFEYAVINRVDFETTGVLFAYDVLAIIKYRNFDFVPIVIGLLGLMSSCVVLVYVLSILMYRSLVSRSATLSALNYGQQKKITFMLLGQGSLPLLFIVVLCAAFFITLADTSEGKSPPQLSWQLMVEAIALYPLCASLLTSTLTTPYRIFFKKLFFELSRWNTKPTSEATVTIVKF